MRRGRSRPGRTFEHSSRIAAARVEMPAYMALAVAVGASLWALCHVVADASYTFQIWLALLAELFCRARHDSPVGLPGP
jgi:hypothetical protein